MPFINLFRSPEKQKEEADKQKPAEKVVEQTEEEANWLVQKVRAEEKARKKA